VKASITKLMISTSNNMSIMLYASVPVIAVLSLAGYLVWRHCVGRKSGVRYPKLILEDQYTVRDGCKPQGRLAKKWPLGLDLLFKASRHAREHTILQLFVEVFEADGSTHEQRLRE
jgi:hypothetical protein